MQVRWRLLAGVVLLSAASAGASTHGPRTAVVAYGPGGPHHVLRECADLFEKERGIPVVVVKGAPRELDRKISEDGDIYFGGAEYMLEDFARRNPGVLDMRSVEKLYARRIGIVVRKGNPLAIKGVDCLERRDVDLLRVERENMGRFHASPARASNVRRRVNSGQEGVAAWRAFPELDAWVTYRSWHVELGDEADFVGLQGDDALRFTPVALTSRTGRRQEALAFIEFLKSPQARRIFVEHGWE